MKLEFGLDEPVQQIGKVKRRKLLDIQTILTNTNSPMI